MKKSQFKISAFHFSKAILVAASLSCFSFSGYVYGAELLVSQMPLTANQIFEKIDANLVQEIKSDASLEFQPIQLSQYEKQGDNPVKLTKASTYNLGHLQDLLKKRFERKLDRLNGLQKLALDLSPDFLLKSAELALESFNFIFSVAIEDTIGSKTKLVAEEAWNLKALVDYAQVSEAYKNILAARTADHDQHIKAETDRLTSELGAEKAKKADEKAAKNKEFETNRSRIEKRKAGAAALFKDETDVTRKAAHKKDVDGFEGDLKKLDEERLQYNAKYDLEIKALDENYKAAITKLNVDKETELQSIKEGYTWIFECFGSSFGSKTLVRWTVGRGLRSEYREIALFDEMLSTKYPDIYPQAQKAMHVALFSLITGDDSERRRQTLKALLGLTDTTYNDVLKTILIQEAQQQKTLKAESSTLSGQLTEAISLDPNSSASSEVAAPSSAATSEDPSKKKPEGDVEQPTTVESQIAQGIAKAVASTPVVKTVASTPVAKKKTDLSHGEREVEEGDEDDVMFPLVGESSTGLSPDPVTMPESSSNPSGGSRLQSQPIAIPTPSRRNHGFSYSASPSSFTSTFSSGSQQAFSLPDCSTSALPNAGSSCPDGSSTVNKDGPRAKYWKAKSSRPQSQESSSPLLSEEQGQSGFLANSSVAFSPAPEDIFSERNSEKSSNNGVFSFGLSISTPFGNFML